MKLPLALINSRVSLREQQPGPLQSSIRHTEPPRRYEDSRCGSFHRLGHCVRGKKERAVRCADIDFFFFLVPKRT
jgi:hypothetical protein